MSQVDRLLPQGDGVGEHYPDESRGQDEPQGQRMSRVGPDDLVTLEV